MFDEVAEKWHLSPAYDLTVSTTCFEEHSTSVCGKGKNINDDDLRRLADEAGLESTMREKILRDISTACRTVHMMPICKTLILVFQLLLVQ